MRIEKVKDYKFIILLVILVLIGSLFFIPSLSIHSENFNKKTVNPFLGESTTFKEIGLPSGTNWFIKVDGSTFNSTTDEITARVGTSGTYTVTWSSNDYYGGSASEPFPDSSIITLDFTPGNNLSFTQFGLKQDTSWALVFNGNSYVTTQNTLNIGIVQTGYYNISWSASGYLGGKQEIYVNAGSSNISLPFGLIVHVVFKPYYFTIRENGLPLGHDWNITVNNKEYSTSNITIEIPEYEGINQYVFSFSSHGYSSNPITTTLTGGSNQSIDVSFSPYYVVNLIFSSNPGYIIINTNLGNFNITSNSLSLTVPQGFYLTFSVNPSGAYTSSISSETIQINGNETLHISILTPAQPPFYFNYDFIYLILGIGIIALVGLIYVKRGSLRL